jgi:hypothetical protein
MLNAKLQPLRTRRAALPQLSIIQQPSAVLQHLSADAGAADFRPRGRTRIVDFA